MLSLGKRPNLSQPQTEMCVVRPRQIWFALAVLASLVPGISRGADIGWPEAVGRLAGERSKAETCAGLLKGHGDKQQIAQGQMVYGDAKANFDVVIAGLVTALTEGGNPKSLPSLETHDLLQSVSDLLPNDSDVKASLMKS